MVAKVPRQARSFACTRQFHSLIVSSSRRRNEKKIKKKWICLSVNRFECRATSHRRMWTPERTTNQHLIRTWIIFIVRPHLHHICTSVEHICEWLLAFRMNCASARHSGRGSDFATKRNSNYILLLFRARPLQISGGLHRMCCCRYLLLIYLYIYIYFPIATKSSQLSFSMKQYVSPVHQFSVATATATGSKKLYKRRARISYSWLVLPL